MTILKQFAAYKEDQAYMDYLEEEQKKLGTLINNLAGMRIVLSVDLRKPER